MIPPVPQKKLTLALMPSWKPFLGLERCFALRFVWSADSRSLHEQQFYFLGSPLPYGRS